MKTKSYQTTNLLPATCYLLPIILFFIITFPLFSSPFSMIPVGDPVLDDILYLSNETGKSFLSFTPPLAPGEIEIFIKNIDPETLSPPAREAYNRIKASLIPSSKMSLESENFALFFNLESTIEGKARFNKDIEWQPLYPKIEPVLSFPLSIHYSKYVQLFIEPFIGADPEYYGDFDTFGTNIPLGGEKILDLTFPHRAFIAAGGAWWNFQLGRDRLSFGTGHMGNFAISDNPAYYEFARLSLFSKYIKYSLLVSQMPLLVSEKLYDEFDPGNVTVEKTMHRYYYLHRFDVNFLNKFQIALMEGIMVGNSSPEIRFLNPMMIFHSFFAWWNYDTWFGGGNKYEHGHMTGSILSLEFNWNIVRSFSLYGQFIMNEFATPYEKKMDEPQPPNATGYLAGARYSHSFNNWASIFYIEFIYTDPYLYMLTSPFSSFIHMNYLGWSSNRNEYRYIGYPRDTIAIAAGTKFFKNDLLTITGDFSWISMGEHRQNNLKWKPNLGDYEKTPYGKALNLYILSVGSRYKINRYFSIKGELTGILTGSGDVGGQASLSCKFVY